MSSLAVMASSSSLAFGSWYEALILVIFFSINSAYYSYFWRSRVFPLQSHTYIALCPSALWFGDCGGNLPMYSAIHASSCCCNSTSHFCAYSRMQSITSLAFWYLSLAFFAIAFWVANSLFIVRSQWLVDLWTNLCGSIQMTSVGRERRSSCPKLPIS